MYHEYTQEELRSYCRTNIETLEIWARRLIHEQMTAEYGSDYFNQKLGNEFLVKKEIRNHITSMMASEPERFKTPVDTLFIDQIIYFLCNSKWYKKLFKESLDYIYPQGKEEAREFLNRLVPIRNPLSHSNPITLHDVERAICYSHDFVEGLKKYYKERGEEQVWNVPRIIKITDSFGNVFNNPNDINMNQSIFSINNEIYCGDSYTVEIEIDSTFKKDEYTIRWRFNNHNTADYDDKLKFTVTFLPSDVGQKSYIFCNVVSNKEWHKYRGYDNRVSIGITILPPID